MLPRIKTADPLPGFLLHVTFDDHKIVLYDVKEDIATLPGLTQKQLGELSGVQQPVIPRMEKNASSPI